MWPFDGRAQRPISPEVQALLDAIPAEFIDDGCSNSPDDIWGFELNYACRRHDWRYCSRAHDAGELHFDDKMDADRELGRLIGEALPWRWRWIRRVYLRAVQIGGGFDAYNSCGPEDGEACRHGLALPAWMEAPTVLQPEPKPKGPARKAKRKAKRTTGRRR